MTWTKQTFLATLKPVIESCDGPDWNFALAQTLNEAFGSHTESFAVISDACRSGIEQGWMGLAGDDQRKGGRVLEPSAASHHLSVDVVELCDIVGPHHRHPRGEVCAVMPVTDGAKFDGYDAGWCVYPPGSAHWPSASGGRLRVMFFLPGGLIEYTDAQASLDSGS